jgi:hypothetical protein
VRCAIFEQAEAAVAVAVILFRSAKTNKNVIPEESFLLIAFGLVSKKDPATAGMTLNFN